MEAPPAEPPSPEPSLISRMLDVFAAPGEVFEGLKSGRRSVANWLVPVLVGCLVGVAYSLVVFSQDSIIQGIRDANSQAIQKQVDAGKLKKEDADKAIEMSEKFLNPTFFKIMGSLGAVFVGFAWPLFAGLVLWLIGRFAFKAQFSYPQALEAAGLTGMINVLGGIVAMLLAVAMGNMAMTPGPVLLVGDFDPANRVHRLLGQLNLFMLWYLAVLALALSKLGQTTYGKSAFWLFGLWAAFVAVSVLPGWGQS